MSRLTDIDQQSVTYVTVNLRDDDRKEVFALRPHDCPLRLGAEVFSVLRNTGRGRIAWHDGVPAAIIGFAEYWPGCWQAVLLGTPAFRNVGIDCLRWMRETASDLIDNHGGRRLQCDSRQDHLEAHLFLRALGAIPEGPPMKAYGKDGSAFQRYVWLAGQNDHILNPRRNGESNVLRTANA